MVDIIIFNKFLFVSLNFEKKLMIQNLARSIPCTMFHVALSLCGSLEYQDHKNEYEGSETYLFAQIC